MATLNANTIVRRGYEAVVLYAGDEVLGGAWIRRATREADAHPPA